MRTRYEFVRDTYYAVLLMGSALGAVLILATVVYEVAEWALSFFQ